jgi:hypothetical protein
MGQMEMKCIFDIGKNISTLAKVTQVSDVAHGPLVFYHNDRQIYLFEIMKYSQHLQNMVYLQNLNDKDNAVLSIPVSD